MAGKTRDIAPVKPDETTTAEFGFFLRLSSSAGKTTVKINSTKDFAEGGRALVISEPITLAFDKLNKILEDNKVELAEGVKKQFDTLKGIHITLPAFYYNCKDYDGKASFFLAFELGANEKADEGGLMRISHRRYRSP